MELEKYFKKFDEANRAQDQYKMMAAMQQFFQDIHVASDRDVLSYYSMASQFELLGMKSQPIKDAVISRVKSQYFAYPATWRQAAVGLNSLLSTDGRTDQIISGL